MYVCMCVYVRRLPTSSTDARRRRRRGDFGDAEAKAAHGQRRPARRSGERCGACAGSQSPAPGGRSRGARPRCTRRKERAFGPRFRTHEPHIMQWWCSHCVTLSTHARTERAWYCAMRAGARSRPRPVPVLTSPLGLSRRLCIHTSGNSRSLLPLY